MPGTGKTTTLLKHLTDSLLVNQSTEISFVSFTRRAINEAVSRATELTGIDRKMFPFFKTLHALTFRLTGMKKHDIIGVSTQMKF